MKFIISEECDVTTDLVIEWLLSSGSVFKRLNNQNSIINFSYSISNSKRDKVLLEKNTLSKIWHRRAKINMTDIEKISDSPIYHYIKKETDSIIKSLELNLKDNLDYVGSYLKETENYKIRQLKIAKSIGLIIPETLITTSKSELIKFLKKYPKSINKDLRYPVRVQLVDTILVSTGVKLITIEMIDKLSENFSPIMVQEFMKKEYEIRLFFFKEKMYPMAIFSQNNSKTQVDFRNYDDENPNRCVPVILPKALLKKITAFNKAYGLNTGSIDLIYTKNKEYVFLEVNPQGQLDWLSKNCNYYIEKDIATFLTN